MAVVVLEQELPVVANRSNALSIDGTSCGLFVVPFELVGSVSGTTKGVVLIQL